MTQPKDKLNQLKSTFVCPTNWEAMVGSHRKRFCNECNKHVYDFSQMTRREVEAVIEAARGNLCARVTRKPDGSIQMMEAVRPALHLIRRRASPLATAVVSAMLGLSPAMATDAVITPHSPIQFEQVMIAQTKVEGTTASLIGTVADLQGAVIPGVVVTLTNVASGEQKGTKTSENGEYQFENLAPGKYSLKAELAPFLTTVLEDVQLLAGMQTTVSVNLQISGDSVTMGIIATPDRTLRTLYEESELIVDAVVGKSVEAEAKPDSEDGPKLLKTALHVNAYFKGERKRKLIYFYHWSYEQQEADFNYGDQLLLFLNPRETGKGGYELSDSGRGIKKLSARDLASYTLRLEELAEMTRNHKPTPAELVDWLVRCALDPATRWEGAIDLRRGFQELQACEQEKKEKVEKAKATAQEAVNTLMSTVNELPKEEPKLDLQIASQLTTKQKENLTQALLAIETLSSDDFELVLLVENWDKERLIPYLQAQLQHLDEKKPHRAMQLTQTLAYLLNEKEVSQLAEQFYNDDLYADEYLQDSHYPEEIQTRLQAEAPLASAKRRALLQKFLALVESKLRAGRTQ